MKEKVRAAVGSAESPWAGLHVSYKLQGKNSPEMKVGHEAVKGE